MPETPEVQAPSSSITCRDAFGRKAQLDLRIDGAAIVLVAPTPGAALLDWRAAEELVVEVAKLRARLPGTPA